MEGMFVNGRSQGGSEGNTGFGTEKGHAILSDGPDDGREHHEQGVAEAALIDGRLTGIGFQE